MELNFEGTEMLVQTDIIETENGGRIPLNLYARKSDAASGAAEYYEADIDGVSWFKAENVTHAMILYAMLKTHVTD